MNGRVIGGHSRARRFSAATGPLLTSLRTDCNARSRVKSKPQPGHVHKSAGDLGANLDLFKIDFITRF